jgi:Mn2+/Fe2+ NRAMP family transporter
MQRFWSILFWSIIAAAFIGPGTVTTAASAGAGFGLSLLWALTFSTIACLLLQEASARITVVSGRNLGEALRARYRTGIAGVGVLVLVLGAIVVGCAAYEAGNILGGVAGAGLVTGLPTWLLTLVSGIAAGLLLFFGATRTVARVLGVLVAVMGVAFLVTAVRLGPDPAAFLRGAVAPVVPAGASVLVLGLVGTTVVPYNLFMGSGLARGQTLSDLRFGLSVAVILGGLISMGIVVVGTAVEGAFGFGALADVLDRRLGGWTRSMFGVGLFAAGISSAITAPLAAGITARSLLGRGADDARWVDRSWRFRAVWGTVLAAGVFFGLSGVKPIPAIIVAQALNGILLPVVAIFLFLTVNDRKLMGEDGVNRWYANVALGAVVVVTLVLGATNVAKAVAATLGGN